MFEGVTRGGRHYPIIEEIEDNLWQQVISRGTGYTEYVYFDAESGALSQTYINVLDRIGDTIVYVVYCGTEEKKAVLYVGDIFAVQGYDVFFDENIGALHGPFIQAEFLDEHTLKFKYMTDNGEEIEKVVTWE